MRRLAIVFLALLILPASEVGAHEVRPGYLGIQQTVSDAYHLLFRVPARGELRLGLYVSLPETCIAVGEPRIWQENATFVERWTVECPGGLVGREVSVDGLASTITDVLARYERMDGTVQVARLTPSAPGFTVSDSESWGEIARTYSMLGIEHILLGIDHLLFVLVLLIFVRGWRRVVGTITAFTMAHSVTLALATLGVVHVPGPPVEAIIALSIVFVASEVVRARRGFVGVAERWPWTVAFAFGLLHGLGFAGALSEIGLPEHAIPLALLFFNLGVEAGQLLFIAAVLTSWAGVQKLRVAIPREAPVYGAYAIGSVAMFWVIQRVAGF